MLTSRAKHAYDFKIIETHALIAIQFDWKREREKKNKMNMNIMKSSMQID